MHKSRLLWLLLPSLAFGACADTRSAQPNPDPRLQALQLQSARIAHNADQCVEQATARTDARVKELTAAGDDSGSAPMRIALDQGDSAIAKCREDEADAQAQVAAQERAEYLREAQTERARAALMATLTSSLGH
jgi:hypothetical protein